MVPSDPCREMTDLRKKGYPRWTKKNQGRWVGTSWGGKIVGWARWGIDICVAGGVGDRAAEAGGVNNLSRQNVDAILGA